jgi:hypothetical protein
MGAEAVGREVVLERGAGAGSVTREWTSGGSAVLFGASLVGGTAEREKGEERGGGPAMGVPCGVGWSWGLAPTGGRAHRCSDSGALALMGGPQWQ